MLSIIIISKSEEDYLPRLLCSLKRQDYKDYEIILADANSTDNTREIAKLFNLKIIDGGFPSTGRNKGFKKSKGNLLLFLDSDIELPNDFLSKNIKEFKKRKLSIATTNYLPISYLKKDKFLYFLYNKIQYIYQYFQPFGGGFCIFCDKKLYEKINGFKENYQMCDDVDFIRRGSKKGKFRILKSVPTYCDVRRLDEDGRWKTLKNYFVGFNYYNKHKKMEKAPFNYELHGGINVKEIGKKK